jgi:hypothetical protein
MGWLLTQVEAEVVVEVPILIRIDRRVTVGDLGRSSGAGARGGGTLPPPPPPSISSSLWFLSRAATVPHH